jgi:NAD(P)-dependent dehydrogenase (short-subunit alcohol dehydrogenase family)
MRRIIHLSNILIISVSSDIGRELSLRFTNNGDSVIGTSRSKVRMPFMVLPCDINSKDSVDGFINSLKLIPYYRWDTLILCPCNPLPIEPFFKSDFNAWEESVNTNAINQLRLLHRLYPLRSSRPNVVFFSGGGVNNAVKDFSAYTISKLMLIKMCEFLDNEDTNTNFFTVGVGWTKTKTHNLILENTPVNSEKHIETQKFLEKGTGTSFDNIYKCITWLCKEGKTVSGGRNFSVVNDCWGYGLLRDKLLEEPDMYKLRRSFNNWKVRDETN